MPLHDGVFLDVGANLGQTLLKFHAVFGDAPYIGFEPGVASASYIQDLIVANKFSNSSILSVGLANQDSISVLNFFQNSDVDSTATLKGDLRDSQAIKMSRFVSVFAFDHISSVLAKGRFSIIKIDVEGGELEVLEGMQEVIRRDAPIVILEILPTYNPSNHVRIARQGKIVHLFKNNDYDIFRLIKSGDSLQSLLKIEAIEVHDDLEQCDYLIVPRSKLVEVKKGCVSCNISMVHH